MKNLILKNNNFSSVLITDEIINYILVEEVKEEVYLDFNKYTALTKTLPEWFLGLVNKEVISFTNPKTGKVKACGIHHAETTPVRKGDYIIFDSVNKIWQVIDEDMFAGMFKVEEEIDDSDNYYTIKKDVVWWTIIAWCIVMIFLFNYILSLL